MTNFKPFNLEDALAGKPCVTRDGSKVIELYLLKSMDLEYPLAAVIIDDKNEVISETFTRQGYFLDGNTDAGLDLFMAPTKKKLWIAVRPKITFGDHKNFYDASDAYLTREDIPDIYENYHIIEIEIEE